MSRLSIADLPLAGLKLAERQCMGDHRGFLTRLFCADALAAVGWSKSVAQINHTYTAKQGTVRGMHFQHAPYAEMKLVSCIRGEVFDVAVDVRLGSPTFLHWHAERLSAANRCALLIPEGFAHGFQALTDDVELLYCHSASHAPASEGGLRPTDPHLGVSWPLAISELSARDAGQPLIGIDFEGVRT
jgi:dTDP-4-dehydrorhamnose 3,5-epimerase